MWDENGNNALSQTGVCDSEDLVFLNNSENNNYCPSIWSSTDSELSQYCFKQSSESWSFDFENQIHWITTTTGCGKLEEFPTACHFNELGTSIKDSEADTEEIKPDYLHVSNQISSEVEEGIERKKLQCMWIDCKCSFSNQMSLVGHIERSHVEGRREDFSCFWHGCPRRNRPFNARYKLLIHMRVHTGHKPNQCNFEGCNKAFSRLENLKIHTRSHTGQKPYLCPYCVKGFSNSSDRAKHQRTHFDTKPYACSFFNCSKRYTDPSSLRKHAKIHYPESCSTPSPTEIRYNNGLQYSVSRSSSEGSMSPASTPSSSPSPFFRLRTGTVFEFPDVSQKVNEPACDLNYSLTLPEPLSSFEENLKNLKLESPCEDINLAQDFEWMSSLDLGDLSPILDS